jgi:hypothetical protein
MDASANEENDDRFKMPVVVTNAVDEMTNCRLVLSSKVEEAIRRFCC